MFMILATATLSVEGFSPAVSGLYHAQMLGA
jgi:hypothetical protein